jgi:hypothetical protein
LEQNQQSTFLLGNQVMIGGVELDSDGEGDGDDEVGLVVGGVVVGVGVVVGGVVVGVGVVVGGLVVVAGGLVVVTGFG